MKAIVYDRYGSPAVLRLAEVEQPRPKDDEILIKILATGVNRSDWESLTGSPAYARLGGLFKPHHKILGSDIAGQVVMAGKMHQDFKEGDEVFGDILGHMGGFAEYVCVRGNAVALKPASLASCIAKVPAPPPAPLISTFCPAWTFPCVQIPCQAITAGCGMAAACSTWHSLQTGSHISFPSCH